MRKEFIDFFDDEHLKWKPQTPEDILEAIQVAKKLLSPEEAIKRYLKKEEDSND